MKKYATLLLAGAIVGFSSCGDHENASTTEQIDSMAAYRTDTMQAALKAQNDSLINAMAKMRADSAMRADSMAKVAATKPATTTARATTKPKTTKPSQPAGTKVTDRPGATDSHVNGQPEKPKSVSDRPGATEINR